MASEYGVTDWLRKCHEFAKPTTEQRPVQFRIRVETHLKCIYKQQMTDQIPYALLVLLQPEMIDIL